MESVEHNPIKILTINNLQPLILRIYFILSLFGIISCDGGPETTSDSEETNTTNNIAFQNGTYRMTSVNATSEIAGFVTFAVDGDLFQQLEVNADGRVTITQWGYAVLIYGDIVLAIGCEKDSKDASTTKWYFTTDSEGSVTFSENLVSNCLTASNTGYASSDFVMKPVSENWTIVPGGYKRIVSVEIDDELHTYQYIYQKIENLEDSVSNQENSSETQKETNDSQKESESAELAFLGSWKTDCIQYDGKSFSSMWVIGVGVAEYHKYYHSDLNCLQIVRANIEYFETSFVENSEEGIESINLNRVSAGLIFLDDVTAIFATLSGIYGYSSWESNIGINIIDLPYDENGIPDYKSETTYNILGLNEKKDAIFLGERTDLLDGSSESKRPINLFKVSSFKQANYAGLPKICSTSFSMVFLDSDGDGFGDETKPTFRCSDDLVGYSNEIGDHLPNDPDEWLDTDNDGIGNNADTDDDNDGIADTDDIFPTDASESTDTDNDGIGNNADADDDNDGIVDTNDSFPADASEYIDSDNDGIGNNADTDDDNDGVEDGLDAFPLDASESTDTDSDGIGNNVDADDDNDGVADSSDAFPLDTTESLDTDSDGIGNNTDTDDDNDGVLDVSDEFPLNATETIDTDGDGIGNNADTDDDNDGVNDGLDAFPLDATETIDTDGDGVGNNEDTDDDDDGVNDVLDAFPLDATETVDTDGDGIGNNADTDDDNDGVSDSTEISNNKDPLDPDDNFIGWYLDAFIKPTNSGDDDEFGTSVSLSGATLAVGSPGEDGSSKIITNGSIAPDSNDLTDSGAVYIYKRTGYMWEQEAFIKPSNASDHDNFGSKVALSIDILAVTSGGQGYGGIEIINGTTVPTFVPPYKGGGGRAIYIFANGVNGWTQEAYIRPVNGDYGDEFGSALSLEGNTLAVGAYFESELSSTIVNGSTAPNSNGNEGSGAVYIYKKSGNNWAMESYIKASNAGEHDIFGARLDISGDLLAVGSRGEDEAGSTIINGNTSPPDQNLASYSGAVYVYKRSGVSWEQEAYIKASNSEADDAFGSSVGLSGNLLVVSARAEDGGNTIINGSTTPNVHQNTRSGAVYVYRKSENLWEQEAYIKADNAGAEDYFGESISLSGNTLAVGSPWEDGSSTLITNGSIAPNSNDKANSGAVYIYRRNGQIWSQTAYIKAANAEQGDAFGNVVSVSGDTLAVGVKWEDANTNSIINSPTAPNVNGKPNSGAVYVFRNRMELFEPEIIAFPATNAITFYWHPSALGTGKRLKIAPALSGNDIPTTSCLDEGTLTLDEATSNYTYASLSANTTYNFLFCSFDNTNTSAGQIVRATTLP